MNAAVRPLTLMGMSGAGKSTFAARLKEWGWQVYECDYEIGTRFLKDEIEQTLQTFVTAENYMSCLARYIGKLGDPEQGGLPIEEFRRRQQAYIDAECKSIERFLDQSPTGKVVCDSTGSLCEIKDQALISRLGQATLFVYLETGPSDQEILLKTAQEHPKPLFIPPGLLLNCVESYLEAHQLEHANQILPDDFARHVFPRLFHKRLPKYRKLTELYGLTMAAGEEMDKLSEESFVRILMTE